MVGVKVLWFALLLVYLADSLPKPSTCLKALREFPALKELLLATGKDAPFDSGKYVVCQSIESSTGIETKFFIVNHRVGEVGVCLPAVCMDSDIEAIESALALAGGLFANSTNGLVLTKQSYPNPFNNKDDLKPWSIGASIGIACFAALVALVGFSTMTMTTALRRANVAANDMPDAFLSSEHGVFREQLRPVRMQLSRHLAWCEAFSVVGPSGTWTSLFKAEKSRPTDCLNGMRVLSMFTIILGHGMLETLRVAGYSNAECVAKTPLCVNAISTNAWSYILLSGQLGVDTFFYIAGFLLSFVGKSRAVPVILGTVLRYVRLFPLFAFVQMMYILVAPQLVYGPFAPRFQSAVSTECGNDSWWSELLFIQAFYPWYPENGGCMGWSWYLSVDMIFAILGMVMLNFWKKHPLLGWVTAITAFFLCIAVTIQQSLHYKLEYNFLDGQGAAYATYGKYLYSRPYSRFPCFLVGLMAPWGLELMEKRGLHRGTQPQTVQAKIMVYFSCLLALLTAAGCIFLPALNAAGPGPYLNKDGSCSAPGGCARAALQWTPWENALWISCSRPLWCVCWLILTFACYFDYLPMVNAVLAHPALSPLATLTFGAYLTHPVIIKIIAGNVDGYPYMSAMDALQRAVMFAILAYSAAIVTWCLVEKPMATLTGWLVPRKKNTDANPKPLNSSDPPLIGTA